MQNGFGSSSVISLDPPSIQPLNWLILQDLRLTLSLITNEKDSEVLECSILNLTKISLLMSLKFRVFMLMESKESRWPPVILALVLDVTDYLLSHFFDDENMFLAEFVMLSITVMSLFSSFFSISVYSKYLIFIWVLIMLG